MGGYQTALTPGLKHLEFPWPEQMSSEVMQRYSREYCHGSYLDPQGCAWYHGNWKYLKFLDLVSNPYWHSHFYLKHISQALSRFAFPRILICGTADDGTLSLVSTPILTMSDPRRVAVTVLDACQTPLMICRDFAERHHLSVTLCHGDAQDLGFPPESFDVIVTDAFLTRFPADAKRTVVEQWLRVLRPNGVVLTTTRVEPDKPATFFERPAIPGIRDRTRYAWRTARSSVEHRRWPLSMVRRALAYSRRMASYPFRDRAEVEALFASLGYDIHIDRGADGLREAEPRDYALVCARKQSDDISTPSSRNHRTTDDNTLLPKGIGVVQPPST